MFIMKELSKIQRRYLKSQAHHLEPILHIGKNGITDGVIHSIKLGIDKNELIKIKFKEFKNDKVALAEKLSKQSDSQIVAIIGHVLILFRQNSQIENQIIKLP